MADSPQGVPKIFTQAEMSQLPHKPYYDGWLVSTAGEFYYLNRALNAYVHVPADGLEDALVRALASEPSSLN